MKMEWLVADLIASDRSFTCQKPYGKKLKAKNFLKVESEHFDCCVKHKERIL